MRVLRPLMTSLLLPLTVAAWAWDGIGHMTVAEIAYQDLASSPNVLGKINEILKNLPRARKKSANPTNPHELFLFAATYPDLVRSPSSPERMQHSRDSHFINYLFNDAGQDLGTKPQSIDILRRLEDCKTNFSQGTSIDQARRLAWLLHLVGDIHQPLHCAARVTPENPKGDLGGNLFYLEPPEDETGEKIEKPDNLHSHWDKCFADSVKKKRGETQTSYIGQIAKAILGSIGSTPLAMKPMQFQNWAKESYNVAKMFGYKNLREEEPPDEEYDKEMRRQCARRAVAAGHRLANALKTLVKPN